MTRLEERRAETEERRLPPHSGDPHPPDVDERRWAGWQVRDRPRDARTDRRIWALAVVVGVGATVLSMWLVLRG
jgi:hypothetical protein